METIITTTDPIVPEVPTVVVPDPIVPVTPETKPVLNKNDLLREMSKEYGVNLFDVDGIKAFKEHQDSQKSELVKANDAILTYKTEVEELKLSFAKQSESMLTSKLGIDPAKSAKAILLAKSDVTDTINLESSLQAIIKDFPSFLTAAVDPTPAIPPKAGVDPLTKTKEVYNATQLSMLRMMGKIK